MLDGVEIGAHKDLFQSSGVLLPDVSKFPSLWGKFNASGRFGLRIEAWSCWQSVAVRTVAG